MVKQEDCFQWVFSTRFHFFLDLIDYVLLRYSYSYLLTALELAKPYAPSLHAAAVDDSLYRYLDRR
jgi:hypothetical protein